ncbi:MAG: hypothetical protein M1814_004475 [Vezdaea aestivalis]|nr:MAG: hypothetical protein M1814_004475 [Vezdaea aestivalis]
MTTIVEPPHTEPLISVPLTCPNCGVGIASDSSSHDHSPQHRIAELESQVRILTSKATAAVDKLADYEDQLHRLKQPNASEAPPSPAPQRTTTPTLPNRLSNLLSPRVAASTTPPPPPSSGPSNSAAAELQAALDREQSLRLKAEGQLNAASSELEELSAQLFTQANEMVAQERRARAKLEARVEVLERRDREKRTRLEKLEGAVRRVERVRGLLGS